MAKQSIFRSIVQSQIWLSRKFDQLLPVRFSAPGYKTAKKWMLQKYIMPNQTILDLGSGSRPFLNARRKKQLNATVIGLDIDQEELNAAPQGLYDRMICTDLTQYVGDNSADIVICMAVLEHIRDNNKAMAAIQSSLKPGGKALLYMPCRNTVFAWLNRVIPQKTKRRLLHGIFPSDHTGFEAFYDQCTPWDFASLAQKHGLRILDKKLFFAQYYFGFFFPFHLIWRFGNMVQYCIMKDRASVSFAMVLEKPATEPS